MYIPDYRMIFTDSSCSSKNLSIYAGHFWYDSSVCAVAVTAILLLLFCIFVKHKSPVNMPV